MSDAISKAIEAMEFAKHAVGPFHRVATKKLTESIEALQALQSREPVVPEEAAVPDNPSSFDIGWADGWNACRDALLSASQTKAPQPVVDVNQQLLNEIIKMLIAVKGAIKLGRDADACTYINAAIAAAQGRNK
jgi:hypothetical protein